MEFDIQMKVKRLDKGLPLPSYAHPGDAGLDLRADHRAIRDVLQASVAAMAKLAESETNATCAISGAEIDMPFGTTEITCPSLLIRRPRSSFLLSKSR